MKIAKKDFLLLRANNENWMAVMKKIAYRDARKDALDIKEATRKQKVHKENLAADPLLTALIPNPLINRTIKGENMHNVYNDAARVRKGELREEKITNELEKKMTLHMKNENKPLFQSLDVKDFQTHRRNNSTIDASIDPRKTLAKKVNTNRTSICVSRVDKTKNPVLSSNNSTGSDSCRVLNHLTP